MRCIYYMIRVHFSHLYTAVDTLVPESRICLCVSLCVNVYICALMSRGLSVPGLLCPCPFLHSGLMTILSPNSNICRYCELILRKLLGPKPWGIFVCVSPSVGCAGRGGGGKGKERRGHDGGGNIVKSQCPSI